MPDASPTWGGLSHTIFLERAASELDSPPQSCLGQAAFLVLRLVDQLTIRGDSSAPAELFRYQVAATERYCREQAEPGAEAERLVAVVCGAADAHRRGDPSRLAPAMLAYASLLEESSRHEEVLDVIETLQRATPSRLSDVDAVAAALQAGRVNRSLARFDAADAAYEQAKALATAAGDPHAVLLSRLGRANVFWGRGNLAEAERWNRAVLVEAQAVGDRDAEALAEHDAGMVLGTRGQVLDAVPHLWRAFELYGDDARSLRALTDLGFALARLGAIQGAEWAFKYVVESSRTQSAVQNATIELLHCASFRRDRVGFERWRAQCERETGRMAPSILTDYHLKLGIGLARFGQFARAATEMERALQVAQAHGLHEFEFRIDRIRSGLRDCEALTHVDSEAVTQPTAEAAVLRDVSAALAGLTS